MSVVVAPELQFRSSLVPSRDRRLPRGHCGLAFSFVGDASGGSATCNVTIPQARAGDRVVVIRAVKLRATTDPAQGHIVANLDAPYLQIVGAGPLVLVHAFDFNLEGTLGTFNSGTGVDDTWPRGWQSLIFRSDREQDYLPLQLVYGTNTNATTYLVDLWGYWWDTTVMRVPGGPKIPR